MGDKRRDVVITGLGPVTSIGVGCDALWSSLLAGRSNVQRRELPVDVGRVAQLPVASMPADSEVPGLVAHMEFLAGQDCEAYRDLGYALLAIELALDDAGLHYDRDDNTIGVIQAFEAPGVERTVSRLFELLAAPMPTDGVPPVYDLLAPRFYSMQAFLYVHLVGKAFGLHGFSTSIHNACSSGAFALEMAAQQIRSGQAATMIVVGGEAFDTGVRLEWFRRLDLYAHEASMRPFDTEPAGFYVGEGAAAMVLESAEHAARRGAAVYAGYSGGAFAHQGWKQTVPDVRSARLGRVITRALALAGVTPADVDLVVPHGAATNLSDGYEAACLAQCVASAPRGGRNLGPAVRANEQGAKKDSRTSGTVATAFKPYVGHMLAASGIIDCLCALLAIKHQSVPATLHTRPEHVQFPIPVVTTQVDRQVDILLKLFTGFTGHDAALVFRRA